MQLQLNTNLIPIFSGTYETRWEVSEYNDNGDEIEVDYKHDALMQSIAQEYQHNASYILSELNTPFIEKLVFNGTFFCPREYNFQTDQLDFTVDINNEKLLDAVSELKNNKEFAQFLHDNYSSYDGFISFTPNNYQELYDAIIKNGEELQQAVSALITYLARENITHRGGCSIEDMVYEDWQGNGYNGLDYSIINE